MSKPTADERFWAKVDKTDGCWLWKAAIGGRGYGVFGVTHRKLVLAHRYAYEVAKGPIPVGLTIDHLCRVRHCVNPDHLEAVTNRVNQLRGNGMGGLNARKTRCPAGHEYAGDNLRYRANGDRTCVACTKERRRERYQRSKVAS